MPVNVERVPGKPIVVVTYIDRLTPEAALEAWTRTAPLMEEIEGTVYRIVDARQAHGDFNDLMGTMRAAMQNRTGSTTDPRVRTIFVGTNSFLVLYRDLVRKNALNIEMPAFHDMDDALTYVDMQLAEAKTGDAPVTGTAATEVEKSDE